MHTEITIQNIYLLFTYYTYSTICLCSSALTLVDGHCEVNQACENSASAITKDFLDTVLGIWPCCSAHG